MKQSSLGVTTLIGIGISAMGLCSVVYWNYLALANANAKESLVIGNENKAEISVLKSQVKQIAEDSKYTRDRIDKVIDNIK